MVFLMGTVKIWKLKNIFHKGFIHLRVWAGTKGKGEAGSLLSSESDVSQDPQITT